MKTLALNRPRLSPILFAALACAPLGASVSGASPAPGVFPVHPMQAVAPTAAAILGVPAPKQAEAPPIDRIVGELRGSKRLAILGIDAFGAAIWDKRRDRTPYLNSLASATNQARLRSVLPSVTCVNFGCMITGGSAATTGIKTRDSEIACENLFAVLRAHGMKSGGFGIKEWTGDSLLGRYADYCVKDKLDDAAVLTGLMQIVEDRRPDFVIVQFGKTDSVFHAHGPSSMEAADACADADAWLRQVVPWLRARGYAVIITADHGQHDVAAKDGSKRGKHGTDSDLDCLVPIVWLRSADGGAPVPR